MDKLPDLGKIESKGTTFGMKFKGKLIVLFWVGFGILLYICACERGPRFFEVDLGVFEVDGRFVAPEVAGRIVGIHLVDVAVRQLDLEAVVISFEKSGEVVYDRNYSKDDLYYGERGGAKSYYAPIKYADEGIRGADLDCRDGLVISVEVVPKSETPIFIRLKMEDRRLIRW